MPDMGIHHLDPAFNALGLDAPTTIEATAYAIDGPRAILGVDFVTYRFAATRHAGTIDGALVRRRPACRRCRSASTPTIRSSAWARARTACSSSARRATSPAAGWSGMPRLLPLELHRNYKRPAKTIPRVKGHHADWLQGCKGGAPPCSNFEYGARLTEFMLLGHAGAARAQGASSGTRPG